MIGYFNYTVWLTYISLLSAVGGILFALTGNGHPYIGSAFLLLSGLCDAFDGKVARTKKNRSKQECSFGIQIDSLADLVAFGVLPICIGYAMLRSTGNLDELLHGQPITVVVFAVLVLVMLFFVLAALIRLAYYNVTEEERQNVEEGCRKHYIGLPVTSACLIFPAVLLLQFLTPSDMTLVYFGVMLLTAFAFLLRIPVRKPGTKGILILVLIGVAEFLMMHILKPFI